MAEYKTGLVIHQPGFFCVQEIDAGQVRTDSWYSYPGQDEFAANEREWTQRNRTLIEINDQVF